MAGRPGDLGSDGAGPMSARPAPLSPPLPSVLIANRGEIAVRIIQACRELGIRSIAVYSEADADGLPAMLADEAFCVGPAPAAESYLNVEHILEAARLSRAAAIHPGYGFLAENSAFARACKAAGIVFVGPSPEAMDALGGKIAARKLAEAAHVPVVPGESTAIEDDAQAEAVASRVGYPLAIKASAGGGGRGLKVVQHPSELLGALARAQWEGLAYFNDATVFIERYVPEPRHVEVQILADAEGNVITLGERECSIQRFHQKLIEEAPAVIPAALRRQMLASAVDLVQGIGYTGAGTVEFLVEGDNFYFLEMNTRIQVEHPVTEMVSGIDIVQAQLRIAAGQRLWLRQDDVRIAGHAIECRINAEDPANAFHPAPSRITVFRAPTGAGVRVDSAVYPGYAVSPHYDSMIAKLIVWGDDREMARRRMLRALDEMVLGGPPSTIPFHVLALQHPDFVAAQATTNFIDRLDLGRLQGQQRMLPAVAAAAARTGEAPGNAGRLADARRFQVRVEGRPYDVEVAELLPQSAGRRQPGGRRPAAVPDGAVTSSIHGVVIAVNVELGAKVERGMVVCTIEAMKMENEVLAPYDGFVAEVAVKVGATVDVGKVLFRIEQPG